MQRLLIVGGTGFVGRALCCWLARHQPNLSLRVATRRLSHGRRLHSLPQVELVAGDVHDDAFLARALRGCDAVVNLVGILHGSEARFRRVHVELPRRLAQACRGAGVRRVVHVSALGAAPDAPSRYLRSKAAGEAVLQTAELDVTILRPSVVFGEEDAFLNLFARLQRVAPVLPLGGAHARFQPVWVQDLARAIATCLARPETAGQGFEVAGPQVHTLAALVRMAGQWSGHERPVLPLPGALARLQAGVLALLPGEPLMSPDNLDSMQVDNVATGRLPGLQALGIEPAAVTAVMPPVLARTHGCERLDAWRARRSG